MTFIVVMIVGSVSLPFIFSNSDNDPFSGRSYSIPQATVDLFIQENGEIKVVENLKFSFKGTYNGVYREIPLKSGESIKNTNVTTDGAYSTAMIYNTTKGQQDYTKMTIYLYSDSQKRNPIKDQDVNVKIEYNMVNVTKIYQDTAEVHFKVWGEEWRVPVGQLTTNVHLNSKDGVNYWFNPPYYVTSQNWQGSVLNVVTSSISPGHFFEVRLTIPTSQFTNPIYAQQMDEIDLANIEKIQTDYYNQINFNQTMYYLISIIILICALIPVFIYLKYGREPKSTYQGEYEREPPSDDPPAVVNALVGTGSGMELGNPIRTDSRQQ